MTSSMPGTARLPAAGAVILALMQLAACGSGQAPSAPAGTSASATSATASASAATSAATSGPPSASPPHTVAGVAACASSTLRPSLAPAGAAAGTAYYALRLRNTSASRCTLYGYPGVSFVGAVGGQQIGSAAARNPLYPVTTVTLAPNATANATLGVATAANYPTARCHPATAHALRVYPPGQTAAVYVTHDFAACSASVPVLTVTAVRAGSGGPGGA
jgi:Domain of unknown function (DUF4232)